MFRLEQAFNPQWCCSAVTASIFLFSPEELRLQNSEQNFSKTLEEQEIGKRLASELTASPCWSSPAPGVHFLLRLRNQFSNTPSSKSRCGSGARRTETWLVRRTGRHQSPRDEDRDPTVFGGLVQTRTLHVHVLCFRNTARARMCTCVQVNKQPLHSQD